MIHRFLFTWVIYYAIWSAFTTSLHTQELITGAAVSLIIALFSFRSFTEMGLRFFHPVKFIYILYYLVIFLRELVKANLNVARIVVHPKLPISPAIVKFKTELKSDMAKLILANSITLTPGTLSVDVVEDTYYIHWLEARTTDEGQAQKEIAEQFEKILRKIFA